MLPSFVTLCEVGLRDGIQNQDKIVSLEDKLYIANRLIDAGLKVIELGSFVSPKAVPQMADTDELFLMLHKHKREDLEFRALVANLKGVERAVACGCKKIKFNVSASRAHNLANLNMTPEESVEGFSDMIALARLNDIEVSGSISMPFGSPWEGEIRTEEIIKIIDSYLKIGVTEISLSDTSGMAVPNQVYEICSLVQKRYPQIKWWLHFHNTRGVAMANILAAMYAGISHFDTSFAGIGGCPFVPGAAGNIATEDVVHMLDEMKVKSEIDLTVIMKVARMIEEILEGETNSYLLKAGASKDLLTIK